MDIQGERRVALEGLEVRAIRDGAKSAEAASRIDI
jgi:hypothetical protein